MHALVELCRERLAPIAHRSGRILYSSAATLSPGEIYLLGCNPGGNPEEERGTIKKDLEALEGRTQNAYLDESWKGAVIGEARIQRRVNWLCEQIGFKTREVCASNAAFMRSVSLSEISFADEVRRCWPVHDDIIKRLVKPRLILVVGIQAYDILASLLESTASAEPLFPSGHGNSNCRHGLLRLPYGSADLVGIPHLSRYAVDKHPEVADRILKIVDDRRRATTAAP